ncbi:MAG: glycosyltransferase [Patescibacteria group bacterium]
MNISKLNIALAHDSLTQLGGAERVLEALHEIYPQAPVFVLVQNKKLKDKYKTWDIRTSWLQIFYNIFPKLQYYLPVIPLAVSSLDFKGYDLVISTSSGFIKNITVPKNRVHINYCHTPARFLWSEPEYVDQEVPTILKPLAKLCIKLMKKWDYNGAQRVNYFISNSAEVQKRVKQFYNRESVVIYPFVDLSLWEPVLTSAIASAAEAIPSQKKIASSDALLAMTVKKQDYFLLAGRLQAHKKNELVIEAFNELGLPLHVAGTGRQEEYLKSIAKNNIKFLGKISDRELRNEYSGALAYIYPQIEDFGLMPLEAAACGTATLAYDKGGSLETIVRGVTGEFFSSYNKDEIKKAILAWNYKKYSAENLQQQAKKFSKEKFKKSFMEFVSKL